MADRIELCENSVLGKAPEFVFIPLEGGVLLDGGQQPELINGALATSLLPRVLQLIDGKRTFSELLSFFPHVSVVHLRELIGDMLAWGVLIIHSQASYVPTEARNTVSFLKRIDPTINVKGAARLLQDQSILIASDVHSTLAAQYLVNILKKNGFRLVDAVKVSDLPGKTIDRSAILVSVLSSASGHAAAKEHYETIIKNNTRWLRTFLNISSGVAEVGPMFFPNNKLCLLCAARPFALSQGYNQEIDLGNVLAWSSIIANDISLRLLHNARSGTSIFHKHYLPLYEYEARTWPAAKTCVVHRNDFVPSMKHQDPEVPHEIKLKYFLPHAYEEAIANRQDDSSETKRFKRHIATGLSPKLMLNSEHVPLPRADVSLTSSVLDLLASPLHNIGREASVLHISTLLALAVGTRLDEKNNLRRWAPSGGNLGSAEAYLVVRNLDGIGSGVYMYKPETHALARLNMRGVDHSDLAFRAMFGSGSPAHIILVGAYERISRKYGSFAYKLLHLDAGAAASQLLLVASALKLAIGSVFGWNSRALEKALALHRGKEVVAHVFNLGASRKRPAPLADAEMGSANLYDHAIGLEDPMELSPDRLVEWMINDSVFITQRLPAEIPGTMQRRFPRKFHRLWTSENEGRSLGGVLRKRSSVREFTSRLVESINIQAILRYAVASNVLERTTLRIRVILQGHTDLSPGVYVYDSKTDSLQKERGNVSRESLSQLFFQPGYEDAPVIFWISANVTQLAHIGNGGYESLLVRAGLIGHRLWMAGVGLGLAGVLLAGITSDAVKSDVFIDSDHTSLIAFACGFPKVRIE